MQKGWKATGLLEAHWERVGGRDGLAAKSGITGPTLSGYNTGRLWLGEKNARKIAKALRVTIFDLGAPDAASETQDERTVLRRLEELEELGVEVERLAATLAQLVEAQRPSLRDQLRRVLSGESP